MVSSRIYFVFFIVLIFNSCIKEDNIKINSNYVPENLNDYWQISTPAIEGINESELQLALDSFFSNEYLHNSKALLIVKNNKLIVEAYAKDYDHREQLQNIKSITKSITSLVVGAAIKKQYLNDDLNKTVYSYIPEFFDDESIKREITIKHCLQMQTGLEDPFYSISSVLPGNSVKISLDVKLVNTPGKKFIYNNGSANILGGVVSKVTNQSFEEFTQNVLFSPLNISNYHWVKHNDGRVNPAFDLYLKPRDILKFGQFCLQNGNWKNKQIIPVNWLQESTKNYGNYFGYHWWITKNYNAYYASGHGGQRLWVIPNKNTVILHLAEPSTDQTNLEEINQLLDKIMIAFKV